MWKRETELSQIYLQPDEYIRFSIPFEIDTAAYIVRAVSLAPKVSLTVETIQRRRDVK